LKIRTSLQRNRYFWPKCAFYAARGARAVVLGPLPLGGPKNHRNLRFFRKLFQWSLGGRRVAKVSSRIPQGTEKRSRRVTFGDLWDHFCSQNCNIGTLLEHCYLQHFQHKMKVWGHSNALWETIWNSILRAVTTLGVSSGLLCPAGSS